MERNIFVKICYWIFKYYVINQCIQLTQNLAQYADKYSIEDIKQAAIGVLNTLGNIQSV